MARKKKNSRKKSTFESRYPKEDKNIQESTHKCSEFVDIPTTNQQRADVAISKSMTKLHETQELLFEKVEASSKKESELIAEIHTLQEHLLDTISPNSLEENNQITCLESTNAELAEELQRTIEASSKKEAELIADIHNLKEKLVDAISVNSLEESSKTTIFGSINLKVAEELHRTQEKLFETIEYQNFSCEDQKEQKKILGAKQAVLDDLPYRMGSTFIQHSKSLQGMIFMPLAISKVYGNYREEQLKKIIQPILPEVYDDYHDAVKVKQHLSYKVGNILVESIKSPSKALKAPLDLLKTVYDFNKSKKS